jgi:hypothetical protein
MNGNSYFLPRVEDHGSVSNPLTKELGHVLAFRWHALDLIERNLIPPFGLKLRRLRRFMIGDMLRHFKVTAVLQVGRNAGPNVPFPLPELFALGAPPKDRASFDLWIAPSTSARLGEAPILTYAPQAA